ncbi:hypothetical protein D3C74_49800 [compost metagenome]
MIKKMVTCVAALVIVSACGNVGNAEAPKRIEIVEEGDYRIVVKDLKTGCEYIRAAAASSEYTYLHGSCTDVIRKEQGFDR